MSDYGKVVTGSEAEEQLRAAAEILRSHGIEMDVDACGCCNSPVIEMRYRGKVIANTECRNLFMISGGRNE